MVICCAVVGCDNNQENAAYTTPMVTFYPFPQKSHEEKRKLAWVNFVNMKNGDGTLWQPTEFSKICSQHFVGNSKSQNPKSPSFNPTIHHPLRKSNKSGKLKKKTVRFLPRILNRKKVKVLANTSDCEQFNNKSNSPKGRVTGKRNSDCLSEKNVSKKRSGPLVKVDRFDCRKLQMCLSCNKSFLQTNKSAEKTIQNSKLYLFICKIVKLEKLCDTITTPNRVLPFCQHCTTSIKHLKEAYDQLEQMKLKVEMMETAFLEEIVSACLRRLKTSKPYSHFCEDDEQGILKKWMEYKGHNSYNKSFENSNRSLVNDESKLEDDTMDVLEMDTVEFMSAFDDDDLPTEEIYNSNVDGQANEESDVEIINNPSDSSRSETVRVTKPTHECDICGKVFKSSWLCKRHRNRSKICSQKLSSNSVLTKPAQKVQSYPCDHCSVVCWSQAQFLSHCRNYHRNLSVKSLWFHYCDAKSCGRSFSTSESLCAHIASVHGRSTTSPGDSSGNSKIKFFECQNCFRVFVEEFHLTIHKQIHRREKTEDVYGCQYCYKIFSTKVKLDIHTPRHKITFNETQYLGFMNGVQQHLSKVKPSESGNALPFKVTNAHKLL